MTLQTKFILLISLLMLAVIASGIGAFWAFDFLHRELRTPFQSSGNVLDRLREVKRIVEAESRVISGATDDPTAPELIPGFRSAIVGYQPVLPPLGSDASARLRSLAIEFDSAIQSLEANDWYRKQIGGTWRNIKDRIYSMQGRAGEVVEAASRDSLSRNDVRPASPPAPTASPSADAADAADAADGRAMSSIRGFDITQTLTAQRSILRVLGRRTAAWAVAGPIPRERVLHVQRMLVMRECYDIHELIERTEKQVLGNYNLSLDYASRVQRGLALWLASVMLFGLLLGVLSVVLLRRWVQRPVAALRDAAAIIARGELTHRIPVHGRDELARLSAEVNHMAEMVHLMQEERVERERLAAIGSMVRRLVHNVRNPLAGIRGLAEVTRLDTPKGSDHRDNLDLIVSTVDTFERWLNELLSVTNPARINPQQTNIREWLRSVVEVHRPMAQSKGVQIVVSDADAPSFAELDPVHLDHALAALLSNAIEASPEQSVVRVEVCSSSPEKEWEITVSDEGSGVEPDVAARIFEPNFTTKRHGTGMGLAMAQQVVRSHMGKIRLETENSHRESLQGARFRIVLPVRITPAT
ncbi:MAG: PAS domain-containing sensor histidine kinase [Phycisphaerales bacterium]